jgi:predicted nucleic acid-binding protein
MIPSAVYDTNVVVSAALYADSLPASLVSLAIAGGVRLFLSPPILAEYSEVLKRPKFQFDRRKVNRLLRDLTHAAIMVTPEGRISCDPQKIWQRHPEEVSLREARPLLRNILGLINAQA